MIDAMFARCETQPAESGAYTSGPAASVSVDGPSVNRKYHTSLCPGTCGTPRVLGAFRASVAPSLRNCRCHLLRVDRRTR